MKYIGSPDIKEDTLSKIIAYGSLDPKSVLVVGDGLDDKYSAEINGCIFYPVGLGKINYRKNTLGTLIDFWGYKMKNFNNCEICDHNNWKIVYEGPIRNGGFGDVLNDCVIARCQGCSVERLSEEDCIKAEEVSK